MNSGGDVLAKGGRSCAFAASSPSVSQEKWDSIFPPEEIIHAVLGEYKQYFSYGTFVMKEPKKRKKHCLA